MQSVVCRTVDPSVQRRRAAPVTIGGAEVAVAGTNGKLLLIVSQGNACAVAKKAVHMKIWKQRVYMVKSGDNTLMRIDMLLRPMEYDGSAVVGMTALQFQMRFYGLLCFPRSECRE